MTFTETSRVYVTQLNKHCDVSLCWMNVNTHKLKFTDWKDVVFLNLKEFDT